MGSFSVSGDGVRSLNHGYLERQSTLDKRQSWNGIRPRPGSTAQTVHRTGAAQLGSQTSAFTSINSLLIQSVKWEKRLLLLLLEAAEPMFAFPKADTGLYAGRES